MSAWTANYKIFLKFKILYYPALYTAKESLEPILEN